MANAIPIDWSHKHPTSTTMPPTIHPRYQHQHTLSLHPVKIISLISHSVDTPYQYYQHSLSILLIHPKLLLSHCTNIPGNHRQTKIMCLHTLSMLLTATNAPHQHTPLTHPTIPSYQHYRQPSLNDDHTRRRCPTSPLPLKTRVYTRD